MDQLLKALGLESGATEDQAVAAVTALQAKAGATATIAKALDLGAVDTPEALIAAVRPKLTEKSEAQIKETAALVARIGELEKSQRDAEFETICTSGAGQGKVPPAIRESLRAVFHANRAQFDSLIAGLPVQVSATSVFAGDKGQAAAMGGADNEAAWKAEFGRDPNLKAEFGDEPTYLAFRKNQSSGRVHILKGAQETAAQR